MSDAVPDAAMAAAVAAHRAGRLDEAQALYRALLEKDPAQPEVLYRLGVAALDAGRPEAAAVCFRKALGFAPDKVEAHFNLAMALQRLGRWDEALAVARRGVILNPRAPLLHFAHANLLAAVGRFAEAVAGYDEAIALKPDYAEAWINRAAALQRLARHDAAAEAYERAVALAPDNAEIRARQADLLLNLGRHAAALAAYDQAASLDPKLARVWSNRALALQGLDRPAEAVESCDRALALDPGFVNALINRGLAERELNRLDDAVASLSAAARAAPDNPLARCNLGVAQLLAGDFEAGFAGHEQRWRIEPGRSQARDFTAPLWLGEADLAGKTLLLHAEQGFGDTIQFCRYAPLAKARGARVVLEVQPALKALMRSLDGVDVLVGAGEPLPPFDLHCPLMSLPLAFRTTLGTIPAPAAYLAPPPDRIEVWKGEVPSTPALKVGLAWFGRPSHKNDHNRSLDLARLMEAMPAAAELFSLHDRTRPEDAAAWAAHPRIRRFDGRLDDFADTAALASMMDVVVSVDTSIAHLAAAIGRPTLVLLPFAPDWRWLLGRDDSPWYPTARLFRQAAIGDWNTPLAALRQALDQRKPV